MTFFGYLSCFTWVGLIVLVFACSVALADSCPSYLPGRKVGAISARFIDEVSGLVASRKNPGVFWVHNDSGDAARVYALSREGKLLGTYQLDKVVAIDFEDIAIGPGPVKGQDYLYIADTGNNPGFIHRNFIVYRVAEPKVNLSQTPKTIHLKQWKRIIMNFPDRKRYDCETLLIDPNSADIYLCTKDRWGDDSSRMRVYRNPAPHRPDEPSTLAHVVDVQLHKKEMAVGGDFAPDGKSVIIRTLSRGRANLQRVLLWSRGAGISLGETFRGPPCVLPSIAEQQGEAICFDPKGLGYYTLSEGNRQPIYFFPKAP